MGNFNNGDAPSLNRRPPKHKAISWPVVSSFGISGARLCAQRQPQRVDNAAAGLCDTAALQSTQDTTQLHPGLAFPRPDR